jgi:hypothetical protein
MLSSMTRDIYRPPRSKFQSAVVVIAIALAVGGAIGGLALVALAVVYVVAINQFASNK